MLAKTHLAFGLFLGIITLNYLETSPLIFLTTVGIASLFPDIDHPKSKISNRIPIIPTLLSFFVKHRGIFHSLLLAIIIPYIIAFFFGTAYGIAAFIGYISHLLMDSLTEEGINYLHPFAKLRLSGFIQTGSSGELVIFILTLTGIGILIL